MFVQRDKGIKHFNTFFIYLKYLIVIRTSFKQAARHASFVEVYISALSSPRIILFGTLSKVQGLKHTLSK